MTNKQNSAEEMLKAWQAQLQDSFKDPRMVDLLVENYAKFQQNLNQAASSFATSQPKPRANTADDVYLQLRDIKVYAQSLESRIAILERLLAGAR